MYFHSFYIVFLLLAMFPEKLMAQYPFQSSAEMSGVINNYEGVGVNYDFSTSRMGLNVRADSSFMPIRTNIGKTIYADYTIGAALNKNTFTLFDDTFKPGVDASIGVSDWVQKNSKSSLKIYTMNMMRVSFENSKVDFALEDTVASVVKKNDAVKNVFAFTLGKNWQWAENSRGVLFGVALSFTVGQRINDDTGLSTRQYCTYEVNGVNADGSSAFITNCSDVKFGKLQNQRFFSPRIDMYRRIATVSGDDDLPEYHQKAIYLLGSYIAEHATKVGGVQHKLIGGFSMVKYSEDVIGALLFELEDFTDDEKSFEDKLAVRFYLGIPLSLKNK